MNPVPTHIAIIMDGNGRWARERGLPRTDGHKRGVEVTEEIVESARDLGVKHLTLYAFSDENWTRPQEEVDALMELLVQFINAKREKMLSNEIRLRTIGDTQKLPEMVQKELNDVMEATSNGKRMDLILALSYGSQQEIARAFNKMSKEGKKEITPEDISKNLDLPDVPNPDLLIRTSGEVRLSNFMLWQLAYTEFYFTDVLWPDFNKAEFKKAVDIFRKRERRFGGVEAKN